MWNKYNPKLKKQVLIPLSFLCITGTQSSLADSILYEKLSSTPIKESQNNLNLSPSFYKNEVLDKNVDYKLVELLKSTDYGRDPSGPPPPDGDTNLTNKKNDISLTIENHGYGEDESGPPPPFSDRKLLNVKRNDKNKKSNFQRLKKNGYEEKSLNYRYLKNNTDRGQIN